jgi:hypothetical protein
MHIVRGRIIRAAIVVGVPICVWIYTAVGWMMISADKHYIPGEIQPTSFVDYFLLTGASTREVIRSACTGLTIGALLPVSIILLLVALWGWVALGTFGNGSMSHDTSMSAVHRYLLTECTLVNCQCVYHGKERFDKDLGKWVNVCCVEACRCGHHANERFDKEKRQWVLALSRLRSILYLLGRAN